jgi:hypothetical protein
MFRKIGSLSTSPELQVSVTVEHDYPNSMTQSKRFTVLAALVVPLGGFVWGFDATAISGAVPFMPKCFAQTGDRSDWLLPSGTSASRSFAMGWNRRGFRPVGLELWSVTTPFQPPRVWGAHT